MFKHQGKTTQCWSCEKNMTIDMRTWVRHTDGLSYAYCKQCASERTELVNNERKIEGDYRG